MAYESFDAKQSQFNAGVALAERIDALQRALNSSRFNLASFNMETQTYNYEVFIESLNGLLSEGWSKFNKKERDRLGYLSELVKKTINVFPPIEYDTNLHGETEQRWNKENFVKIQHLLRIYERELKDALDNHSLNSPNKDDDDDGL